MSKILTNNQYYSDIANAIRSKNNSTDTYKPSEMAGAISAIEASSGFIAIVTTASDREVTATAPSGKTLTATSTNGAVVFTLDEIGHWEIVVNEGIVDSAPEIVEVDRLNGVETFNIGIFRYLGRIEDYELTYTYFATASSTDYAVFAGGSYGSNSSYTIDLVSAYNTYLTKIELPSLSCPKATLQGGTIADYVLFAAGSNVDLTYTSSNSSIPIYSSVDGYTSSFTKVSVPDTTKATALQGSCSNDTYLIFAGGYAYSASDIANADAYNSSLTKTACTNLSVSRTSPCGANAGDYIVFAAGTSRTSANGKYVDAYDKSLTHNLVTSNFPVSGSIKGTSIGEKAVFASGAYSIFYAYDESLTLTTISFDTTTNIMRSAASNSKYGLFISNEKAVVADSSLTFQLLESGSFKGNYSATAKDKILSLNYLDSIDYFGYN